MSDYSTSAIEKGSRAWLTSVSEAVCPRTRTELRRMVYLFARADFSFADFGATPEGFNQESAVAQARLLEQKIGELRSGLSSSELVQFPEYDRLLRIFEAYDSALQRFFSGEPWVSVPVDVGELSATLHASDVRSVSRGAGFGERMLLRVRTLEDEKLIADYRAHSLLGPDTVYFLEYGVPVASVQYFLGLFDPEALRKLQGLLSSAGPAKSVSADPFNAEYLEFLASTLSDPLSRFSSNTLKGDIFKKLYPELDWEETQYTLHVLWKTLTGTTEEKISFLKKYTSRQDMSLETIAILVRQQGFAQETFDALCEEYEEILSPYELISFQARGIDLSGGIAKYRELPRVLQSSDVFAAILASSEKYTPEMLAEFASHFDPNISGDRCDPGMLSWYFDDTAKALEAVRLLKSIGIRGFNDAYSICSDSRVPVEYFSEIYSAVNDADLSDMKQMHETLNDWHRAGLSKNDILQCGGLWNRSEGVPWYNCTALTVQAYLKVKQDPKKMRILQHICATYGKIAAEVVIDVDAGYSQDNFDFVESNGLFPRWLKLVTEFPRLKKIFQALSAEEREILSIFTMIEDIVPKLRKGKSLAAAVRALIEQGKAADRKAPAPETKIAEDAYSLLLGERAKRHDAYVRLFVLFGVSAEYMAEKLALSSHKDALDDVLVNHIILCAYIENKIPPAAAALIEKNGISEFTRYPVDVLLSMTNGYAEREGMNNKVALMLFAKTDWNNALDSKENFTDAVYKDHDTYVYEVATRAEFFRAIRQTGEELALKGKEISLVCFNGHGNSEMIQLGFPYSPRSTELEKGGAKYFKPLRNFLAEDAQLVLASCSAAKGGEDGDNLARTFARTWPGVEVFASNTICATTGITFAEGRVASVDYSEPNSQVVIKV